MFDVQLKTEHRTFNIENRISNAQKRERYCDCPAVTGANALSFGFPAERRYAIKSRISSSLSTSINPSGMIDTLDGRRIVMSDFFTVSVAGESGLARRTTFSSSSACTVP